MIIIKQFASEFKIKLVAKFSDPVSDMFGLHFQIFFIVKTDSHFILLHFFVHFNPACKRIAAGHISYSVYYKI